MYCAPPRTPTGLYLQYFFLWHHVQQPIYEFEIEKGFSTREQPTVSTICWLTSWVARQESSYCAVPSGQCNIFMTIIADDSRRIEILVEEISFLKVHIGLWFSLALRRCGFSQRTWLSKSATVCPKALYVCLHSPAFRFSGKLRQSQTSFVAMIVVGTLRSTRT